MSEFLSFNPRGQWTLHKATSGMLGQEPKSDHVPGNKPYKVYSGSTMTGELHADYGTKGTLRDFGGGSRPKHSFKWSNVGKPFRPAQSAYADRHPGVGVGD